MKQKIIYFLITAFIGYGSIALYFQSYKSYLFETLHPHINPYLLAEVLIKASLLFSLFLLISTFLL